MSTHLIARDCRLDGDLISSSWLYLSLDVYRRGRSGALREIKYDDLTNFYLLLDDHLMIIIHLHFNTWKLQLEIIKPEQLLNSKRRVSLFRKLEHCVNSEYLKISTPARHWSTSSNDIRRWYSKALLSHRSPIRQSWADCFTGEDCFTLQWKSFGVAVSAWILQSPV